MRSIVAVLLSSALPLSAQAAGLGLAVDPETQQVSSADRLDETLEQIGNSVTVITRQEIDLRNQPFVADLLRSVPGLDVVQFGGVGGTVQVSIRGSDPSHTLVMLDGVPLNDASEATRSYDLSSMTTDNVERIEVLRGPQSVMYGSDAIGGVINIITRKGEGKLKASAYGERGSYETNLYRGELSGGSNYLDYSASGSRLATGGIPFAGSDYGNTIRDPYRNDVLAASLGLKPMDGLQVDVNARNTYAFFNIADIGGAGGEDPAYTDRSNETDLTAKATLTSFHGLLVQKLSAGIVTENHLYLDQYNPAYVNSSQMNFSSYGQTTKFSYQAVGQAADWNTVTVGLESQEERAHTDDAEQSPFPFTSNLGDVDNYTKSAFAEDLVKYENRFFVSIGGRYDDNDEFGNAYTYRVAPAFLIPETSTKLKASVGTGFKTPSLYELFSQYGVSDLAPERSVSWDAGFEQDFLDRRWTLGATYFHNNTRDLIQFNDATMLYYNVDRAITEGYEVTSQYVYDKRLTFKSNFTYTAAEDVDTGAALLRVPRLKFSSDVEAHPVKDLSWLVGMTYTGPRWDSDYSNFPATSVDLGGYALWHTAASYALNKYITLTARVDNILNKRYEPVEGYGALGVAGYGGVKLSF